MTDTLEVYAGNGDGTFQDPVDHTTSVLPVSVNSADVNGDGIPDVLVSSDNGNSVSVHTGTSGGSLSELTELSADGAYEATAADVTSDGTKDLLVASSSDDAVDVFTGSCS
ncbi:VCBS repeat protein [Streptomyces sp. Ag109_O5-1]|uniref:FG-GAP repeat domain-containing protein n=1 Tax=Streptomyces sp. Ag109_O5-1 TaxID=1938851 RepID=UPI000F4EAEA4|nr:VCBS repeat-containing protein [Streptomyces sp. Ag109_O5-1]RPE44231.1 VCBS repeat protein [Streptomyces sp. Ag109_O5-1]